MPKKQLSGNPGTNLATFVLSRGTRRPRPGTALKWDWTEQSRGCPCHGSRFGAKGRLAGKPAPQDCRVS